MDHNASGLASAIAGAQECTRMQAVEQQPATNIIEGEIIATEVVETTPTGTQR